MPRRPVGLIGIVNHTRDAVVPDPRVPGRWVVKVQHLDRPANAPGAREQDGGFTSEAEARAVAEAALREARQALVRPAQPGDITVGALYARLVSDRALGAARRHSTDRQDEIVMRRVLATWGDVPVNAITKDGVNAWLRTLVIPPRGTGTLAPLTVQGTLAAFRHLLGSAEELGVPNPIRRLPFKAERSRFGDPWTPAELRELLAAAREEWRDRPQWVFALWLWMQSGLRAGEVAALRVQDLDVEAGTAFPRATYSRGRLGPLKVERQHPASILLPTLSDDRKLVEPGASAESWGVLEAYAALPVRHLRGESYLFGTTPDQPWRHQTMRVDWQRIVARTGFRYREPEIFRHTMAAIMASRGASTALICQQGAWTSMVVVERVYARYRPDALTKAVRPAVVPAAPARVVSVAQRIAKNRRKVAES